ncbi:Helix-turn-helix [Anaerosphaera aminiphila DSM 21120]|uniref:Helix-turn-helix n=1 Tax=Anaerosphaera aminiphila DSM 21120 TaxID=1120995 RepID=A0A1M5PPS8_9FIRM|nr:helix-turn-helix transcriptional regulator [Anaerosphaera aminiphila]SHH03875.1 Helix-turn-helix [Anaerosphaera aminiphila DSM 21120]
MDQEKIGLLIRNLRLNREMTQKQLAEKLNLSDKTISKWERGLGSPDISLLIDLAGVFKVDVEEMLSGELTKNQMVGGNMKNSMFYICPLCGNLVLSTGSINLSCCGRKLEEQEMKKATEDQKLKVEAIDSQWYITSEHPMSKSEYISFVAFANSGKIEIEKQYPEWNLQVRIPKSSRGKLIWYSTRDGLLYQLI